jgi:hypothetical protein
VPGGVCQRSLLLLIAPGRVCRLSNAANSQIEGMPCMLAAALRNPDIGQGGKGCQLHATSHSRWQHTWEVLQLRFVRLAAALVGSSCGSSQVHRVCVQRHERAAGVGCHRKRVLAANSAWSDLRAVLVAGRLVASAFQPLPHAKRSWFTLLFNEHNNRVGTTSSGRPRLNAQTFDHFERLLGITGQRLLCTTTGTTFRVWTTYPSWKSVEYVISPLAPNLVRWHRPRLLVPTSSAGTDLI